MADYYEGFEFVVVGSFDLQGFEAVGFDSDLYFKRFPKYDKANQNVMTLRPSCYKNAYKCKTYWDDDHKDDDGCRY